MATLQDAIVQIQALVSGISGIRGAPDEPPDQISHYPFAVCFPESGVYEAGVPAGCMQGLHDIVVELHVARKDLPRDYRKAIAYAKSIPNAILNALGTVNLDTVSTVGFIRYEFGVLNWGETPTMGFRFVLESVKTTDTLV